MISVYVYLFSGTYAGKSDFEWNPPEKGANHKCLLFLRQNIEEVDLDLATMEISAFGFIDVKDLKGNSLSVEALSTDTHRGFSGFYESALEDGSCLVYYPNT